MIGDSAIDTMFPTGRDECRHGSLRRKCLTCELEAEIATLRARVAALTEALRAVKLVLDDGRLSSHRMLNQIDNLVYAALAVVAEEPAFPFCLACNGTGNNWRGKSLVPCSACQRTPPAEQGCPCTCHIDGRSDTLGCVHCFAPRKFA